MAGVMCSRLHVGQTQRPRANRRGRDERAEQPCGAAAAVSSLQGQPGRARLAGCAVVICFFCLAGADGWGFFAHMKALILRFVCSYVLKDTTIVGFYSFDILNRKIMTIFLLHWNFLFCRRISLPISNWLVLSIFEFLCCVWFDFSVGNKNQSVKFYFCKVPNRIKERKHWKPPNKCITSYSYTLWCPEFNLSPLTFTSWHRVLFFPASRRKFPIKGKTKTWVQS